MLYIFIIIVLFLFALQYDVNRHKVSNTLIVSWWLVFVLLAGLRFKVGGDTSYYMTYYDQIPKISGFSYHTLLNDAFQPLWVILCSICKTISNDFTFFQFVHAIITNSIIFYFIKKNSNYFFTGILFYFIFYYFYFNTEVLRETLAICVFLLSVRYFFLRKWTIYYLLCFVAFGFHISAIILFFFPLFSKLWTKRSYFIFFIIILILLIIFNKINIYQKIFDLIPNEEMRAKAISQTAAPEAKANIYGVIYTSVVNIIIPFILIYIGEQFLKYKFEFRNFLYLYVLISLFSIFLSPGYRFLNYLTPIYYLFLANMLNELFIYPPVRKYRYTIVLFIFLLPFSVQLMTLFRNTSDQGPATRFYSRWYPYHSVFNKGIESKK
jgi:hypothetical protein